MGMKSGPEHRLRIDQEKMMALALILDLMKQSGIKGYADKAGSILYRLETRFNRGPDPLGMYDFYLSKGEANFIRGLVNDWKSDDTLKRELQLPNATWDALTSLEPTQLKSI